MTTLDSTSFQPKLPCDATRLTHTHRLPLARPDPKQSLNHERSEHPDWLCSTEFASFRDRNIFDTTIKILRAFPPDLVPSADPTPEETGSNFTPAAIPLAPPSYPSVSSP